MLPDIPLLRIDGKSESLRDYAGKVLLVVNVASRCGFTPQYRDLQALYLEMAAQGLEILALPCNQFGAQEPGSASEIQNFCSTQYGVTFPLFEKVEVNGRDAHPLYTFLKKAAPGVLGTEAIKWNFTKFLIDRSGAVIKRYASTDGVPKIASDIKALI